MKKAVSLLLAIMCLMCLFACTENEEEKNEGDATYAQVDIAKARYNIIAQLGLEGTYTMDTAMLLNVYGIEEADVKESACFATMEGVFPDEVIIVRATSSDAADRIEGKLKNRLEAVLDQSKNYDAENYAIAQKCKVITEGDVVALFISAHHEEMQRIFYSSTPDPVTT